MDNFFHYEMLPTTWFYLSSLMIFALFFRFDRFLSIRNLDLVALILLMGGFLLVAVDLNSQAGWGYFWMFGVGVFLTFRLLFDPLMVRRPLLEPNLSFQGMLCAGCFLIIFIIGGLIVGSRSVDELGEMVRLDQAITIERWANDSEEESTLRSEPGYAPFLLFSEKVNIALAPSQAETPEESAQDSEGPQASWSLQRGSLGFATEVASPVSEEPLGPVDPRTSSTSAEDLLELYPPFMLTGMTTTQPTTWQEEPDSVSDIVTVDPTGPSDIPAPGEEPAPVEESERTDVGNATENPPLSPQYAPTPIFQFIPADGSELLAIPQPSDEIKEQSPLSSMPETGFWMDVSAPILAWAAQIAIVVGMILISVWHFDNLKTGIAAATLYLLLPYTNQMPGRLDHIVPAALLVWAVACYRMPILSGVLLGTASGLAFFPLFCVPLWIGFYWRRGLIRFLSASSGMLVLMILLLLLSPDGLGTYGEQLLRMFGAGSGSIDPVLGFWTEEAQWYRIPVFAVFLVLCIGLAFWPAQKHLGALISLTAAIMLFAGFWQPSEGGLYMAWYLPLLIMTAFRPNLEDRTAEVAVRGGTGL
jgi:hypothetical protein